jgi:hypothetical protein
MNEPPPTVNAFPASPLCRRCGERLNLAPLGIAEPSVDAVNLANGVPYCQRCILALQVDA